jgi:ElaB/YqjD/DUF883 family membrane-anchored ribosome-binding protein
MDQGTDNLQQNIVDTRHDIEETRASMNEKLELLEERVRDTLEETKIAVDDIVENVKGTVEVTVDAVKETVDGAKSTVENIVENVKDTMNETVTKVKRSVDLGYQVEQHPWLMLGGSVVAGRVLASLLHRGNDARHYSSSPSPMRTGNYVADATGGTGPYTISGEEDVTTSREHLPSPHQAPTQHGWGNTLGQFQEEFDMVKSVATGAVMSTVVGTLQELIRQNIPSMAPRFDEAAKRIATKWGAEPNDAAPTAQSR